MGAKTWMLVYAKGSAREALAANPALDRDASLKLARQLFPGEQLNPLDDGDLYFTNPPDDEIIVGCFEGVAIVAAKEFRIDNPSQLPEAFIKAAAGRAIYLHAMHSVVDWFAFGYWVNGALLRSLSVAPDYGEIESIGEPLEFEAPFLAGDRPAVEEGSDEEYALPYHPLELGEAALVEFFGYQLEGGDDSATLDPESIPLLRFKRSRSKSRWRFWSRD